MKKSGHRLFSGGAVMLFVPMGLSVIIGAVAATIMDDYEARPAPAVAMLPIAGPMLMAVQLNMVDDVLPPTLALGAVFTSPETVGFIMMWSGTRKMAESGRHASAGRLDRDRRHAVRDLIVAPTFGPGSGGLAVAGRF